MASFDELIASQKQTGEKIEIIIRNYKKDPSSRKTSPSYFQERLRRLDEEWAAFETTDNKIRLLDNLPLDHQYFKEDYYTAVMNIVQQYKEEFEQSILKTTSLSTKETQNHSSGTQVTTLETGELTRLIRRQAAMMSTLERILNHEFSHEDIVSATKLWQSIEGIHYEIAERCGDNGNQGYDMDRFIQLENHLRTASRSITLTNANSTNGSNSNQSDAMPIPKITIPRFDGNYLKWQEFHDLFSSLIVNQSIPNVQKIWYLKTHLVGEAGNLIKHFTASGENFHDAWSLVVDRYNNKRLLVSKLVQELVDSPIKVANDNYKTLHDKTQECLLALKNLNIDTSSWDPLLLHLLWKRLDNSTRLRFEQSLLQPREVPTIKAFLEFLEKHFQSMEAMDKERSNHKARVCTSITARDQRNEMCNMCKRGTHPLFACKEFLKASPSARLQFTQGQKLCVNCLKAGHKAAACLSRGCTHCNKKHNTLLHLNVFPPKDSKPIKNVSQNQMSVKHQSDVQNVPSPINHQEATSLTTCNTSKPNKYILLSTAMVTIKANQEEIQCRAILDSGSQLNLVSERLVKRLGISPKSTSIYINGIGSSNTKAQYRVNVALHSRINNFTTRLEAAVLPHIISPQPSQLININNWPIPKNIVLADPEFHQPAKIDVLLGAEFYHQLLSVGKIQLAKDLPTIQNTVLGWVIAGPVGGLDASPLSCGVCTGDESSLEEAIAQLWELETVKPAEKCLSVSEKQCETHFAQTVTLDTTGRFVVRIPFCKNPDELGDSHGVAFNRFLSLERRLAKTPEIKEQYIQFMKEYEALGHMTEVDINSTDKPKYFIPHHCVFRPESQTTKLRVVFDASTKTSDGMSLNDLMFTGPTIQSDLFSLLLRFRLPRFVFTTDIQKMYRQILMHPEDRKYQLIIWREGTSMPLKYYQLNTVTYGTRSAPYLATKCLEKIAKENMARYPYGAQFLLENFYVDDGIGGNDNLNIALVQQRELQHILQKHGFHLQKWSANHKQLIPTATEQQQEVNIDFNNENNQYVKTLGLTWMPNIDKFSFKVNLGDVQNVTKRSVSSDIARVFDPLGLLSPIIVTAKMFLQELWQINSNWDDPLPSDLHQKWCTFREDLVNINNIQISRHVFEGHVSSNIQLHAFADASEKAYGAALYIRSVIKNEQVIVRLLCAKSRVAPVKRQTLPRLELCAALLSVQLTAKVKNELKLEDTPTYFWTDSEIVLAWINSPSSSYQTFVANRVAAIQESSLAAQWRHVKSTDNPADIVSRGLSPKGLTTNTLWFYGPLFLHGRKDIWPPEYSVVQGRTDCTDMERKKTTTVAITNDSSNIIYEIRHNGSFNKLNRVVGFMLRFINNARGLRTQSNFTLSTLELERATITIIGAMQRSDFKNDLKHLAIHNTVHKNSLLKNLTPFLDSNGIIRVGGRLESSELSYDAKHPMVIPYLDPLSKVLMQTIHVQNRHCGPQALLSYTRQKYWPIKGRSTARSIVQHCIKCARAKPKLLTQIMGNLPSTRTSPARPFINSGVDFCGPFWVHYKIRGKRPTKAYIAVFCCFATKAVHLEVVSSLTTDAFIGALKRFISRRGHCKNLYCDNATNFVGANNQLAELSEAIYGNSAVEKIDRECTARGMMFHFIPPRAPHFGGLWEAAVKSAKHLLMRSVSTASLTYEEFDTVVIEIEGILNSRPISPMSDNPNDLAALTPGHFLIGAPLNSQIEAESTENGKNLLTRWKLVTHLKSEFWRRWSREYLSELQYRYKWNTQQDNIKTGDMVVVKEDNTAPLQWPLGRIVKTHKGDDGFIRVADVKTSKGVCRRPISRLAPLPINNSEEYNPTQQDDSIDTTIKQNETIESKRKRRRMSISQNIFTIMMAIILMPLVLTAQIQNKQFGKQLGIHFEAIGSAAISSSDWQILIYYDLQEFWSESEMFATGTRALSNLCEDMQDKSTCQNLVKYFDHTKNELDMSSTLLSGRRHKRGAINLVGNIANSLFGVLDSKYAEEMANTISQVKQNEGHLLSLLRNQTSIVDSTMNILKADQGLIKKKFDQIDQQISQVYNKIHNVSKELYEERIYRIFSSLSIQLTITAANLQHIQSSILDILTNTHHGIISPLILTPYQLQQEIDKIRRHLPESLELPVEQNDTLQLYKLMKVQGGLTNNTVIFRVNLPLVERDQFLVFNLIAVPNWINDTLLSIKPCSSILGVNVVRRQYFTLDNTELNSCDVIKTDRFVCSKVQILYEASSPICACEINLFHNETKADCPVQQIKATNAWIPLHHQNKWIYALPTATHTTAVCKKDINQFTLMGSGLLYLEPECTLKNKFVSIQGQQTTSSSLKASYTKLWEITEQIHSTRLKPLLNKIHTSEYSSQIQKLTDLQTSLRAQEILQLPNKIETHNYHHMTVGYSALIITFCILFYLMARQKCKHQPTPAPHKEQTTSDFTVHI